MRFKSSKKFRKASKRLQKAVAETLKTKLKIFEQDPFSPSLNNHALRGSMRNYRSIDITNDYRLIYEWAEDDIVRLVDIGTHSELYKK